MSKPTPCNPGYEIVVIKLGGSVLTGPSAFQRAAGSIADLVRKRADERYVIVVSAELGQTDDLSKLARTIVRTPDPAAQDLLWSIGELRSVAILTLYLQQFGVAAVGLNVHESGLARGRERTDEQPAMLNPLRIRHRLSRAKVVVVPGFLARDSADRIVSLGRGGSDLTAVLLATALRARRCELVKDVPGYFTADPQRDENARPVASLNYDEALAMARAGCDLVQESAIETALQGLPPPPLPSLRRLVESQPPPRQIRH